MDTIKIFNNLCIGPCDVTKLNETAYLLPKRKHPTLYSNRDEQMEDEREGFPADQYMRVLNEKTVNRNRSKQCKRGKRFKRILLSKQSLFACIVRFTTMLTKRRIAAIERGKNRAEWRTSQRRNRVEMI